MTIIRIFIASRRFDKICDFYTLNVIHLQELIVTDLSKIRQSKRSEGW